eukprot:CAMPEP_0198363184 /NCGR_PEP_ID=MMETSP1450-20131203/148861_1 /TAXON_ID=753684 ORGANISM="Madagascaria erythrocladiodes, Strain CCMP3234" /NCGR_SAMPLE_ID=MMETSP1450 /ASSEMBLY_ACC=CAM_ASM_001115 /LENGTH=30 /DNA_ID= /DNA_START= /DNA_END= /DNA_ORIENTATION=
MTDLESAVKADDIAEVKRLLHSGVDVNTGA